MSNGRCPRCLQIKGNCICGIDEGVCNGCKKLKFLCLCPEGDLRKMVASSQRIAEKEQETVDALREYLGKKKEEPLRLEPTMSAEPTELKELVDHGSYDITFSDEQTVCVYHSDISTKIIFCKKKSLEQLYEFRSPGERLEDSKVMEVVLAVRSLLPSM